MPWFFQAEDGIRDLVRSRGLGDVYKRQGQPFDARVLGCVLQFPFLGERIGVPARVGYHRLDQGATLDTHGVPIVALAGTCMEAGKTAAACALSLIHI